jgi:hypothetical protein
VERAGVRADLGEIEEIYAVFGGAREDVSMPELLRLARRLQTSSQKADAPDRLEKLIGDGYVRTARVHFMPQGAAGCP